jgi:predicted ester cyclase
MEDQMSEANKALVKKTFDAINRGDVAQLNAALHPKFHKAAEATLKGARAGFGDMRLHIEDMIAEGDKIVTRWTMQGTHKGEAHHPVMGNVRPTNKHVKVSGITIHQIANGKVIHTWGETNELKGLAQLGLVEAYHKAIHRPG